MALFDTFFDNVLCETGGSYPPYDIVATAEDKYTITLAVAGFSREDVDVSVERGALVVKGQRTNTQPSYDDKYPKYMYKGIARRRFEQKFNLGPYIKPVDVYMEDGMLSIDLQKEVPEEARTKKLTIR